MIRYYILNGDKTTASGWVIATTHSAFNHGRALAMIGDSVYCDTCKSTGHIIPQGPRWPTRFDGREPALDRDLCACKCRPYPLLINSRTDMAEIMTTEEVIAQGYGSWIGIAKQTTVESSDELLEQYFEFVDDSGSPVNLVYRVETFEGTIHEGTLGNDGRTIKVPYSRNKDMRMTSWTKAI